MYSLLLFLSVLLGAKSDPNLNIDDPVCDHFFNDVWNKIAQTNAIIYEKVRDRAYVLDFLHTPTVPFYVLDVFN